MSPRGTKTWQVLIGRTRSRVTLGHYPKVSLKEARELALKALAKKDELGKPKPPPAMRADEAIEKFITLHYANARPMWRKEQRRLLTKHFLSKFPKLPLDKFTTAHILEVTDALSHIPSEQLHAHRALKTFFKWAVHRQWIAVSPISTLPNPGSQKDRDRLISDAEFVAVYKAAVELAFPFGYIVLICAHTGLRRGEVSTLKWKDITSEFITIPKEIAKNGREHVLPNLIAENLKLIPKSTRTVVREDGEPMQQISDYLFPSATGTPFAAWGRHKVRLDKLAGVEDFVLHDLRRYLSSTMRRLGVPIDVTECILNYVSGSRSQIQRIYDRHDCLPEMRDALALYERHLAAIISAK